MAKELVECEMCDAIFSVQVVHYEESHGFPAGLYPVCPHCGHASATRGTESDREEEDPHNLCYSDMPRYATNVAWPKTIELLGPFVAFRTKLLQLESMRGIPMEIGWLARLWQKLKDEELLEQCGSLDATLLPDESAFLKRVAKWFSETPADKQREFAAHYGPTTIRDFRYDNIWRALHSILTAQITSAWTAFETLAGDLWEAALNAHPHTLASLAASGKPDGLTIAADRQQQERKDGKKISVEPMQKYRFDLSKHMGTLLRRRFNFTSLNDTNGIRAAYWAAFKGNRVRSAIDASPIKALACVRNVLAHKAGVIDEKFSKEIASVPALDSLHGHRRIPLTGPFTHDIVSPAVAACKELVSAVDDWIDGRRKRLSDKMKRRAQR